jgi:quercetin dioxygenase-like cupin family protein
VFANLPGEPFLENLKYLIMKKDENNTAGSNDPDKKNVPAEIEKTRVHIIVEIIEYVPNSVVSKTIIKKSTGNISVTSFDTGEELAEKTSPFDTYIQIIDGSAEVIISGKKYQLKPGEGIVIPAHASHSFNANEQFKMISTVIKSGYEE